MKPVKPHPGLSGLLFLLCAFPAVIMARQPLHDSIAIIKSESRPNKVIDSLILDKVNFIKVKQNFINFGLTGDDFHYVLLKVNRENLQEPQFLCIDNTSLDTVYIYRVLDNGKSQLAYLGGTLIPFNRNHEYVWHTVPIQKGKQSYYFLALKAAQKNINVRYEILPEEKLRQKYLKNDRIIFIYTGIVSLIIIVMVLAYFLFREAVFAFYLGYIVCAFIWILAHYGYLFPNLYPNLPILNEVVKPVSSLGAAFFLLQVLKRIFRKEIHSRKSFEKVVDVTAHVLPFVVIFLFLLLIPEYLENMKLILIITWHVVLVFAFCLIAVIPVLFFKSGPTAKILSAAMLVICTMTFIHIFSNSGFLNNIFIAEHGISLGSLIENLIIAFGVFYNLLQERKQREEQLSALETAQAETLKRLVMMQDNERKRIAGDLHDNIGPLLAALKINFNRIINHKEEEDGLIMRTEAIINDSIMEIRNIAHNLMPKGITSKGLINALNDYFESMQTLYQKSIAFKHDVQSIFQPELQINLYRIICELVLNAAKHSNAHRIEIILTADAKVISILIFDDGQGFPPDKQKKSLGLQNAESRVNYLHGQLIIESGQGKGTAIRIDVPL